MLEKYFEDNKLRLLEEVKTYNQKVKCIDDNGYLFFTNASSVKRGFSHNRIVYKENPFSIENIKTFLKNNGCEIELLSSTYNNNKEELLWKCKKCGSEFKLNWQNFLHSPRKFCSNCNRNRYKGEKYDIEYVRQKCSEFGLYKVDDEYIDARTPFTVIDKDGYFDKKCLSSIISGKTSIKFDAKNEFFCQNVNHWLEVNHYYSCKLLDKGYGSNKEKMTFLCSCGNEYKCYIGSVLYNNPPAIRCPRCRGIISNNELKVKQYLQHKRVKFVTQKKFEDCRLKKPLTFDFYLPDYNTCIEVDGELHYKKKMQTQEEFEALQKRDEYKNEYCKSHNINLIRIPYWNMYNKKYKKIINNILS